MGQERTWTYCRFKYFNVTQSLVKIYCETCVACSKKNPVGNGQKGSRKSTMPLNWRLRFELDLMDFCKLRKRDPFGVLMRWILTLKDHATALVHLCTLPRKRANLIAYKLQEIFGIIGYPMIFYIDAILVNGVCLGADKQGSLPLLTIILHKNHQIYIGTQYETCSSAHVSETVIVPHHGQPGGFHCPARVYLLRSPSAATREKMGITCTLSASNLAKHCKTSWVSVTLQRLAHTTPQVCIPHICLHFSAAALQETRPFQAHSLLCHYHAYNI
jgi:hypothetical protein